MNMPFYPPKIIRFAQDTHGFVPNFMTPASTEKVATKTTRQEDSPEKKKQETHTHPKQKIKTKQNLDFPQLFLLFLFFCCVVFVVFVSCCVSCFWFSGSLFLFALVCFYVILL
jgi:Flp pilus assembly protein TadB